MEPTFQRLGALWHIHNDKYCIWMTDETFQRYLTVYVEGVVRLPHPPSPQQALQRVMQLSYWTYARYERNIHFLPLPECILQRKIDER